VSQPSVNPEPAVSAKAEATRAAIVETAEQLFRNLGYQKTAVADIARALRMSPANVYRFFPSKAAINEAICARTLGGLDDAAWMVARRQEPAEARLRALFAMMQQQTMSLFFKDKRMHDMVQAALEEHWTVIEGHIQTVEGALRHIIMDGQREGVFARMDPEQASQMAHWATVGFTHPGLISQCRVPDDLPHMASGMAEFVLRALRVNPRTDAG
jgi:AcrR family transcriptional regulator